jgi:hypothetical protein
MLRRVTLAAPFVFLFAAPALAQAPPGLPCVTVHRDATGRRILPDRALASAGAASNELTFTYNSPTYPWTSSEIATLQGWIADFYPAIKALYGPPGYANTVNVRKDPNFPYAGNYDAATNELVVRDLGASDPICHEIIHAFHDEALVSFPSYEEGMTRACEVAVFNALPGYTHWDENHQYPFDRYYEYENVAAAGATAGNLYARDTDILVRYQLAGYAWAKLLLESPTAFVDFNAAYYAAVNADPTVVADEGALVAILRTIRPSVEGMGFDGWYAGQHVLNTHPASGYALFQRGRDDSPTFARTSASYFRRESDGSETVLAGQSVSWQVFDWDDTPLGSGVTTTSALGVTSYTAPIPAGHVGRIRVIATATTPDGPVATVTRRGHGLYGGIEGVVVDANDATVEAEPLDVPVAPASTALVHGCFALPGMESVTGRVRMTVEYPDGRSLSRIVTKDASGYFVSLESPASTAVAVAQPSPARLRAVPGVTAGATRFAWGEALGGPARLVVLDVAGRAVRTLDAPAGASGVGWDGSNDEGRAVPAGVYFARLASDRVRGAARLLMIR